MSILAICNNSRQINSNKTDRYISIEVIYVVFLEFFFHVREGELRSLNPWDI